ncbi:MAG TPA: DNA polymerase III subunit beta [Thermoleophilia bacterium]|nr:DNA polymerase III subunit beta [Thermoleophilia bacterium]
MKFTCDRSALVDKLGVLARGVSTRSALPVLSGILLQAGEGRLDLYSTDMELSIKATLQTPVERDGEIVVPARLFSDVVRNLADEDVAIEAGEAAVKVSCGRASFSLNSWAAADFPQTSTFDMTGAFKVGRDPFVETLNKAGRAASRDETRPILTGVLMTIMGDTLKMVATDSYRLAVKETKLDHALDTEVQAIVPVKALGEVTRLASALGPGDIEVAVGENQVVFKLSDPAGDVWIASRLIEGQFPNYKQLLPETFEHEVTIDRGQLMATARRVSLLAQKNAPLRMSFAENSLTMKALTQDVGQAEESLDVAFTGEPFEIGFNPGYLIEGVDAVDDEEALLRFTSPLRPGLVSGPGDDFTYLIMPIRLSS